MSDNSIHFDDGASYERMMGRWSLLVGERFIEWLAVPVGARWLDVGCGNGAFTELVVQRCAPEHVLAIDPSPGQLDYARARLPGGSPVSWAEGDAMSLPAASESCDAATMALVLFFVPEPAVGLSHMCRAVKRGGTVAAYHWDILGGGFPLADIGVEMKRMGVPPRQPPSVAASTLEASEALWRDAGLDQVRTTSFTVQRSFESFDEYWDAAASSNTLRPMFNAFTPQELQTLRASVRARLGVADLAEGAPLVVSARANAVSGVKA